MTAQRRSINLGLDRFSGFYLWALFILIFGIWKPHLFLTWATVHSVASSQAIGAMLAIAVLVPLAAGAFDLSVGATINLAAIMVTWLQTTHHWNMWPAMFMSVAVTFVIGVFNGFLVVKLRISSFIATLGMATVIAAIQTIVSGESQPLPPTAAAWNNLTQRTVGGFQIVVLYLLVLAVFFWWLLEHTPAGRYIHATGGNQEAARLAGVQVDRWIWLTLIISATVSGVAGVLYGSLSGPSLTFGSTLLLPAFAAAFLGSTQIRPGRFNVWGTMLAVYVLATGVKGLQLVTGVQWLNDMFNGVALIAAVGFAVWRQRTAGNRRRREAAASASTGEPHEDAPVEVAGLVSPN
jgi:ribose transport system permease protein